MEKAGKNYLVYFAQIIETSEIFILKITGDFFFFLSWRKINNPVQSTAPSLETTVLATYHLSLKVYYK